MAMFGHLALCLLLAAAPVLARDAPRGFEAEHLVLYQSDPELRQRLPGVEVLAIYARQLEEICRAHFADATVPETLDVVVAVRPGRRSRVWLVSSRSPVELARHEELRQQFEAVEPFAVQGGPVAFAISGKVAGGTGRSRTGSPGYSPPLPQEWRNVGAGREKLAVPDGVLDLIWPEKP